MKERKRTDYIVVHCSAEPAGRETTVEDIRRWHLRRGFLDVGYHYVIRTDGEVEIGRPVEVMGAHVRGYNHNSIGICLIGGTDANGSPEINFTEVQMERLDGLLAGLAVHFEDAKIVGHRDLYPNKACPSFDVGVWRTTGELKD